MEGSLPAALCLAALTNLDGYGVRGWLAGSPSVTLLFFAFSFRAFFHPWMAFWLMGRRLEVGCVGSARCIFELIPLLLVRGLHTRLTEIVYFLQPRLPWFEMLIVAWLVLNLGENNGRPGCVAPVLPIQAVSLHTPLFFSP